MKKLSLSPFNIAKLFGLGVFSLLLVSAAARPMESFLVHSVDLIIHEAGHALFMWGPHWLEILGGSLFQVLLPLALAAYAALKRRPLAAALLLMWTGQSLIDVSVYAGDALKMELPLISEHAIHDWNHLLWQFGLLRHTYLIAGIIKWSGWILIGGSFVLGLFLALMEEDGYSLKRKADLRAGNDKVKS